MTQSPCCHPKFHRIVARIAEISRQALVSIPRREALHVHLSHEKRGRAVNSLSEIRRECGDSDFQTADLAQIEPLPLTAADKTLLASIGLPVSPKKALTLNLRFASVFIRHQPHGVRLLKDTDMEKGP